jgi:pimeloyl-ACP methyl ester carboxylesterase
MIRIEGSGRNTITFLHGLGCDHDDWEKQQTGLSSEFTTLAFDLPGHGNVPPLKEMSVNAIARFCLAQISAHVTGPVMIVGHSLGCRIALEASRIRPDAISGLVLIDSSRLADGNVSSVLESYFQHIEKVTFENYIRSSFGNMFSERTPAGIEDRIIQRALKLDSQVGSDIVADLIRWDSDEVSSALMSLNVPFLVLQASAADASGRRFGLSEGMTTPWTSLVAQLCSHAEIRIVERTGHFPQIDAAVEVTACIEAFARSL